MLIKGILKEGDKGEILIRDRYVAVEHIGAGLNATAYRSLKQPEKVYLVVYRDKLRYMIRNIEFPHIPFLDYKGVFEPRKTKLYEMPYYETVHYKKTPQAFELADRIIGVRLQQKYKGMTDFEILKKMTTDKQFPLTIRKAIEVILEATKYDYRLFMDLCDFNFSADKHGQLIMRDMFYF